MPRIRPYNPSIKWDDYLFRFKAHRNEEEKVRQWFLRELIETYGYSLKDIEIEVSKQVGNTGNSGKKGLRADIVVDDKNSVKGCAIVIELKSFGQDLMKLKNDYEIQLLSYINQFYPKYAVITDGKRICVVRRFYVDNEPNEEWLTDLPTFDEFKNNIKPAESKKQFIELQQPQNRGYDSRLGKISFLDRVIDSFSYPSSETSKRKSNNIFFSLAFKTIIVVIVFGILLSFVNNALLKTNYSEKNNTANNKSLNGNTNKYYPITQNQPTFQNTESTGKITNQSNSNFPTQNHSDEKTLSANLNKSDSNQNIESVDNQTSSEIEPNIKVHESDNWKESNSSVPKTELSPTPRQTPSIQIEEPNPPSHTTLTPTPVTEKKPEIIEVTICSYSGRLPNPYCPSRLTRKFRKSESPTDICTDHKKKNKVVELLKDLPKRIP